MKLPFLDSKIDLEIKWHPAPHLSWEVKEEQTLVVDPQEGKVFHFNGVGAAVWNGVTNGLGGNQIAASIAQEFDAPEKQILKDVSRFLSQLQNQDLIVPRGESHHD